MNTLSETALAGNGPKPARQMEGIGDAADRIMTLNGRLSEIVDRFHGPSEPVASEDKISVHYTSQIVRLHTNIDTLNNLINALDQVA